MSFCQAISTAPRRGQSTARFSIALDGAKADGVLHFEAIKVNDEWTYQVLQVEVPGQEPIALRAKAGSPPSRELTPPTLPPAPRQGRPTEEEPGDDESDIHL